MYVYEKAEAWYEGVIDQVERVSEEEEGRMLLDSLSWQSTQCQLAQGTSVSQSQCPIHNRITRILI